MGDEKITSNQTTLKGIDKNIWIIILKNLDKKNIIMMSSVCKFLFIVTRLVPIHQVIEHENGLKTICNITLRGEKIGLCEQFYGNGILLRLSNYYNNVLHGDWIEYYESGQVFKTYSYKHGKINGWLIGFTESGNLHYEREYKEDQKHGDWIEYFEDGVTICKHYQYKNNKCHGYCVKYKRCGEIDWHKTYKNGKETIDYMFI